MIAANAVSLLAADPPKPALARTPKNKVTAVLLPTAPLLVDGV
jgi:hypothetical protein